MDELAKETYDSLNRLLRELENNLKEGESIGVQSNIINSPEFYVQTIQRNGTLIAIIGDTEDGELEELVFSPSNVSIRLFTAKRGGQSKPIGFIQKD